MNSSSFFKALMFGNKLRSASAQTHFIIHYILFFPALQCLALLVVQVESQNKWPLLLFTLLNVFYVYKVDIIHATSST